MSEDIFATNTDAAPLTAEKLQEAFRRIEAEGAGGPHVHVVYPKAEGWTRCADCMEAVFVVTEADGRKRLGRP